LVYSFNERNSYFLLINFWYKYLQLKDYLKKTASDKLEEGENDVKSLWPL